MTTETLPLSIDLPLCVGATFRREFRWKPDGVTPQNLSGWTGVASIGLHREVPLVLLDTINGGLSLSSDGVIALYLSAADTIDLGKANFYVIDLNEPSGVVVRFLRGNIVIVKDFEL